MKFRDDDIERFWFNPESPPRKVPPECRKVLYRKLQMLDAAVRVQDLKALPATGSSVWRATDLVNAASGSTTSGAFASGGKTERRGR